MRKSINRRKLFSLFGASLFLLFCCLQPGNLFSKAQAATDKPISEDTLVYRTTDGGANWFSFAEFGEGLRARDVRKMAVDPIHPEISYLATSNGVFKSTDEGNSWKQQIASLSSRSITDLVIDPLNPSNVYLIADSFYKSQDGGNNWEKRLLTLELGQSAFASGNSILSPTSMAIDPVNPANIYVGARGIEYVGVYKSTDGGNSFRFIQRGFSISMSIRQINIDAKNPSIIYLFHDVGRDDFITKSLDAGETLSPNGPIMDSEDGLGLFLVDPQNPSILYLNSEGILKSLDGGLTWSHVSRYPIAAGLVAIDSHSTIYGTRDEGLVKSVDGARSFTSLNFNRRFFALAFEANNPQVIYAAYRSPAIYDPKLESISVDGKNLVIHVNNVSEGAKVAIDSQEQVTKATFAGTSAIFTVKKGYKRIRPGQTVFISVVDVDGYGTRTVAFSKPL
jgi:photosystem II stability/assembly factor-like uncharacterized protein